MPIFDKKPNGRRNSTIREGERKKGNGRGKSKVNGSWKPKKRGNKPNGPTWQE